MSTTEQVEEALRALPDDPAEIANLFEREGIRGVPNRCGLCPVATYLYRRAESRDIAVGCDRTTFYDPSTRGYETVFNPRGVRDFIVAFDEGAYAELTA